MSEVVGDPCVVRHWTISFRSVCCPLSRQCTTLAHIFMQRWLISHRRLLPWPEIWSFAPAFISRERARLDVGFYMYLVPDCGQPAFFLVRRGCWACEVFLLRSVVEFGSTHPPALRLGHCVRPNSFTEVVVGQPQRSPLCLVLSGPFLAGCPPAPDAGH